MKAIKGLLVTSLSGFFVAVCAVSAPTPVFADTIASANWTTATSGNPGSASGTLAGGFTVAHSGQTSGLTTAPQLDARWQLHRGDHQVTLPPSTASVALEGDPLPPYRL